MNFNTSNVHTGVSQDFEREGKEEDLNSTPNSRGMDKQEQNHFAEHISRNAREISMLK